jgi:ferritin-like metal-binding protein YciE
MQTGRDFCIYGLTGIYDAEQQLVEALGELEQDSNLSQLKKAFATHRAQTEKQVQRLEQAFEILGEQPEATECHGIRGIIQEKKSFMEEDPSPDLIDVFSVGGAIKTESYEVAEYESLIDLAEELGEKKIAKLLGQTLKEEQATLKKMQDFEKKVKPEHMGAEVEAEEEGVRPRRGRHAA